MGATYNLKIRIFKKDGMLILRNENISNMQVWHFDCETNFTHEDPNIEKKEEKTIRLKEDETLDINIHIGSYELKQIQEFFKI